MIYDKKTLQTQVAEVKAAHEKYIRAQRAEEIKVWERAQKAWEDRHKPDVVATLTDALKKAKAGTLDDTHHLSRLRSAPTKPKHDTEVSCAPIILSLNTLSTLLDTVVDDTISASALARAGVPDLTRLLRRPC